MGGFPCQTFSYSGKRGGLSDPRGQLYLQMIRVIEHYKPKMFVAENVDGIRNSRKDNKGNAVDVSALDTILEAFDEAGYNVQYRVLNAADYGVPQLRERVIFLLTRKDIPHKWEMPPKENKIVTLYEAIGDLPILDPLIYDIDYSKHLEIFPNYEERTKIAEDISFWHKPPKHVLRQVISMQHTPTGETAFDNKVYFPVKKGLPFHTRLNGNLEYLSLNMEA